MILIEMALNYLVSTHSHPKVAANAVVYSVTIGTVSTHSHPKVAACCFSKLKPATWGFNTQPPEGGCVWADIFALLNKKFQHTATRRWLHYLLQFLQINLAVSTHSHPKVAAQSSANEANNNAFQHTATRRWLRFSFCLKLVYNKFQHTATRRWLLGIR